MYSVHRQFDLLQPDSKPRAGLLWNNVRMSDWVRLNRAVCLIAASCTGLLGCLHNAAQNPTPAVQLQLGQQASDQTLAQPWWPQFGAPELTALIKQALANNQDLQAALARVDQSRAVLGQAGAGLWPGLELRGNANRAKSVFFIGPQRVQAINNRFSLSAAASYELDVWGRIRSGKAAAAEDLRAAALDAQAAAQSVAAQVAETWLSLIETRQRIALVQQQAELNVRFLELTRLRFENGDGSVLAIRQQQQQQAAVLAQLPLLQAQQAVLRNQLALLLAQPAPLSTGTTSSSLPQLPALPLEGVPADLLLQRPDVMAAQRRVVAADQRVGSALAARLPGINLSASAGYDAQDSAELFDELIWSLGAGLIAPVFDAGRLANAQRQREAQLDEALARFTQAALLAATEVRNALAQEQFQHQHLAAQQARVQASEAVLEAARERYSNGLSDFLPVLTALVALQSDQQAVISAERQLLAFRVQLYRALGGAWADVVTQESAS